MLNTYTRENECIEEIPVSIAMELMMCGAPVYVVLDGKLISIHSLEELQAIAKKDSGSIYSECEI